MASTSSNPWAQSADDFDQYIKQLEKMYQSQQGYALQQLQQYAAIASSAQSYPLYGSSYTSSANANANTYSNVGIGSQPIGYNSPTPSTSNPMPPAKFKQGDKVMFTKDVTCDDRTFAKGEEFTVLGWSSDGFQLDCTDINGNRVQWGFNYTYKDYVEEFSASKYKISFETIVMPAEKKEQIRSAISQLENHKKIFEEWGFSEVFEKGTAVSLLFWGPPGTGKTLAAQAIADSLGLKLKIIQTAEIESSEPGQAERNIKAFFSAAVRQKQLLLFDECDSLINDRNEVGMILGAQINALLTALEQFTGVVVFTTNRLGKMDPAMQRRISATIEFEFPTESQRHEIWKRLIPSKAPLSPNVDLSLLAKFPIAGGNIKNAILSAARFAAYKNKEQIDEECFEHGVEKEIKGLKGFEAAYKQQKKMPRLAGAQQQEVEKDGGRLSITREMDKVEGEIEMEESVAQQEVVLEAPIPVTV